MANIYNEPGSTDVKITLKNNDYAYLNTNIGIAKMCLITNQKKFGYSDLNGNLKKCLTDASGSSVTPENCVFIADNEGSASHSTTFVYNDNKLGVNIAAPQNKAHFHEPSTGNCLIQITNTSRGSSDDNDGMTLGVVGDDNVIRTTYGFPVKIQVEDDDNPGTFVDLATFQNTGWHSNTILDTDLTVSIIPAKSTAASVFLTHEENTIKTRTADQVLDDIGAAAVSHTQAISTVSGLQNALDSKQPLDTDLTTIAALTHSNRHVMVSNGSSWTRRALEEADLPSLSISKITNLQTTLDDKQATITGTENKVLSIQAGGSGVKTGVLSDDGTNVVVNGVLALRGYTDVAIDSDNRFYRDVYHLNSKTQTTTGTMKITLPKTWSSTMLTIKIVGYNYTSVQGKWECNLGGYNYIGSPAQWVNTSAQIIGNAPFSQVRFAHDGSKCVVLLGNTGTIWNYPQIAITEVYAGYGNQTGWGTGYSISFITSETGITNIVAPTVNSGVSADWNALINKPSTFAPAAHNHTASHLPGNIVYTDNAQTISGVKTFNANTAFGKNTFVGGYKVEVEGNTLIDGGIDLQGFLDMRSGVRIRNKADSDWLSFITRDATRDNTAMILFNTDNIYAPTWSDALTLHCPSGEVDLNGNSRFQGLTRYDVQEAYSSTVERFDYVYRSVVRIGAFNTPTSFNIPTKRNATKNINYGSKITILNNSGQDVLINSKWRLPDRVSKEFIFYGSWYSTSESSARRNLGAETTINLTNAMTAINLTDYPGVNCFRFTGSGTHDLWFTQGVVGDEIFVTLDSDTNNLGLRVFNFQQIPKYISSPKTVHLICVGVVEDLYGTPYNIWRVLEGPLFK